MFTAIFTNQFKKDYKLAKRRYLRMEDLDRVLEKLISGKVLEHKYKDHALIGKFRDCRECHIDGDWLLIYRYEIGNSLKLNMKRSNLVY